MPQRLLKPGLPQSKRFNRVSWPAQSLFVRLITLVDDMARYEADPEMLASLVFPFGEPSGRRVTPARLTQWLQELRHADLLCLYETSGQHYLHLHRWTERCRANWSRFPAIPAGICRHLPAIDSKCQQPTTNVASTTTTTPTTTPTPTTGGDNKNGVAAPGKNSELGSQLAASRTQWAALTARQTELKGKVRSEWTESERVEWQKNRADLKKLGEKQRAGVFA